MVGQTDGALVVGLAVGYLVFEGKAVGFIVGEAPRTETIKEIATRR